MEDEECLPENSSLKLYLQNLGFSDLQITKNSLQNPSSFRFEFCKPKLKGPSLEILDEDVIDQISIIVSTQMLFEEDVSSIEKLLSNFKVERKGMFKSMFQDLFGVGVIFLGFCLFWVIGYYAFFIVSSFYAFNAANYLKRKHFNRSRLKKLTSILQANFMLLKRTVKFVEENKIIESNSFSNNNSKEFIEGFDFYKNFKSDFLLSVNEMINILTKSTQKLINKIPLYDYIETPEYYLCNNYNKTYESSNLSKLYEIYLLVQSEFLQRLILSLIPNINVSAKDSFHELNKILTETCVNLMKIKNKLNKKFKFLFVNGIHSPKAEIQFKLPLKQKSGNIYFEEFLFNIHETSKTFQNLLIKCRVLEERITSDEIPEYIEEDLLKMQQDLNFCQSNISDSLILFKKANSKSSNLNNGDKTELKDEQEEASCSEELNKIMVGYSDFDPKIEDEIFEAYFTNENCGNNLSDIDDCSLNERLEKKLEKEYCKNVMKELKLKLTEKAKYWRKREKELLEKKGIIDVNEDTSENESDAENLDEEKKEDLDSQLSFESGKLFQNSETKNFNNIIGIESFKNNNESVPEFDCKTKFEVNHPDKNSSENTLNHEEKPDFDEYYGSSIMNSNKDFLSDLYLARKKIFKSNIPVQEELFCISDEDSLSEDNPCS